MRLSLIASLAALGVSAASDNFDDDDLNFLRLLSSNASSNSTMAPTTVPVHNTTVAPMNTTVAPMNTTVAPATTVAAGNDTTVAPMNTTVAPVATTVAATAGANATTGAASGDATTTGAASGDATTTGAASGDATTTGAASGETTGAPAETTAAAAVTTVAAAPPVEGDLCTAKTYTDLGLKPPTTIAATTADIGMSCTGGNLTCTSSMTCPYMWGSMATTAANLEICTTNGGAANALKCGATGADKTAMTTWLNQQDLAHRQAVLGLCCGYPSGFGARSLSTVGDAKLYNAGEFHRGIYTDDACATPMETPADDYKNQQEFGATMEHRWTVGSCIAPTGAWDANAGLSKKIIVSNGTAATGGYFVYGHYFDTACANILESGMVAQKECTATESRRLGAHPNSTDGGGGGTMYEKMVVEGTGEVADLQIVSDTRLTFTSANLPAEIQAGSDESAAFVDVTAGAVLEAARAAATAGTTEITTKYGTGRLASEAAAGRRLSKRRQLAGHESDVIVVTETVIPAGQAATAKTALETDLAASTLGDAVVAAIKADSTLGAIAGNLTAPTITVDVEEPTVPVSTPGGGGGGSTSGATSEYLGFAAGAALFASALFL